MNYYCLVKDHLFKSRYSIYTLNFASLVYLLQSMFHGQMQHMPAGKHI